MTHPNLVSDGFWRPFEEGHSLGQQGSESGVIIRDEEHVDGARITLERDAAAAPFAITCGVYGWMVHSQFFATEASAQQAFDEMKSELANILGLIPAEHDPEANSKSRQVVAALSDFIKRFP